VPRGLKAAYEQAGRDPELTSLREELILLRVRTSQVLQSIDAHPPPAWAAAAAAVKGLRAAGEDPGLRERALGELEALVRRGAHARRVEEAAWAEVRELIRVKAKTARVEWLRLGDLRLLVSREQVATAFVHMAVELRECLLDPELYAKGPTAVLREFQRRLDAVFLGPRQDVMG
jgi:hypothetical protein